MRRLSSILSMVPLAAALVLVAPAARAGDEAAAEALFGEAKKLAAAGKFAEACPKFAESNRLDRGAGTMLHLADCYEKNKQLASAWATYKDAAGAAQAANRKDWEKLASTKASALEPKIAKLTIKVDKPADKIEVTRDGTSVSQASWGVPIPVDSGQHIVAAAAPGKKAFKLTANVAKDGDSVEVTVPALENDASAAVAPTPVPGPDNQAAVTTNNPSPPDADKGNGSGQRTVGFIVGGVGVAGIAVGAITGLMAMGKSSDAKDVCPNDGGCANQTAVDSSDSAKTLGLISTIGFAAGGAALVAGAVLIFTAPKAKTTTALRVAPYTTGHATGVGFSGSF